MVEEVKRKELTPKEVKELESIRDWSENIVVGGGIESWILALASGIKGDPHLAILAAAAFSAAILSARRFQQIDMKLEKSSY